VTATAVNTVSDPVSSTFNSATFNLAEIRVRLRLCRAALQWSKSFAICEQLQSVYRSADFFQLLRVSDFGFLSVFGLRPSGFRLRRAAFSAV